MSHHTDIITDTTSYLYHRADITPYYIIYHTTIILLLYHTQDKSFSYWYHIMLILAYILLYHTVQCRYNAVQYDKILHKLLEELKQNINQMLDTHETPHIWSLMSYLEKSDRGISGVHCTNITSYL